MNIARLHGDLDVVIDEMLDMAIDVIDMVIDRVLDLSRLGVFLALDRVG